LSNDHQEGQKDESAHISRQLATIKEFGKGQEGADGHTSIGSELSKGKGRSRNGPVVMADAVVELMVVRPPGLRLMAGF